MPITRKELHFFDDDKRFRDAEVDYATYHANFAPRRAGQLRGEVTPSYLFWLPAAERLARYNPLMKIIVSDRARSFTLEQGAAARTRSAVVSRGA